MYQMHQLSRHLNNPSLECEYVMDIETAERILACRAMNIIVIDSTLKEFEDDNCMKDFIQSLKATFVDTKIVIFNGIGNRTIQRQFRRKGADGYLSSNNSMKTVAGSVSRLLGIDVLNS